MEPLVNGLHHVTAFADDAQTNLDFYAGILGMRLVKKTVNFDAPDVYHLYYGNEDGSPGTIMTFFPYKGISQGRHGKGQLTNTSFSIPANSLGYWTERLKKFNIKHTEPQERFDEAFIYFEDKDGLGLELVATAKDDRPGFTYGQVPEEHAVKGFHSITLTEDGYEKTAGLLTTYMNHSLVGEKGNRFRYSASGKVGDLVDIVCAPEALRGLQGKGTVHHVAFSTDNDDTIEKMRELLASKGANVTPVLDRQYFHSIYFREPGGVLFEVATNPPGFAIDEERAKLGEALKLPEWEEPNRPMIEKGLTPITLDWKKFL
jgi:glyoxalase family protein